PSAQNRRTKVKRVHSQVKRLREVRTLPLPALLLAALFLLPIGVPDVAAQERARFAPEDGYALPPAEIQDIFSRDPNFATLRNMSPDGNHFVVPLSTELSPLTRMAETTYRLGELELRPTVDRLWHLDTYGIYGLRLYSLADRSFRDVALPDAAFVSDLTWSPDGSRLAFLAHLPHGTEVWTADASGGSARRLSDARVMATIATGAGGQGVRPSRMLQWTPEGTVLALLVPLDRGPEPARPAVPTGPGIRRTFDEPVPTRTFPFLLQDDHDADLFEHFTRSQLAELAPGRSPRPIGEPAMYQSISLSPDGRHVLASTVERPFSLITSWSGFPRRTIVVDRAAGTELATLEVRPLRESGGDESVTLSNLAWRPDGAGLSFVEEADSAGEGEDAHRIMLLQAPFDVEQATVVATSAHSIGNVTYSADGRHAFATLSRSGQQALAHFDLAASQREANVVLDFHRRADPLTLPGDLVTMSMANGIDVALVSGDASAVYLQGDGLKADFRPQPFVDRLALDGSGTTRIFEGSRDTFDQPLVPLDPEMNRIIVSRESKTQFPDSWLWSRDGSMQNLTHNVDPFAEVTAAERIDFEFSRRDGVKVQGRLSLPLDYVEGTKVPAIFWTYPREFTDAEGYERAAIRARNHNAFHHMTWLRWSDMWLTQGYAVAYPDIPIIGENYNDTYIASMVDAMYGAIRAVDELGYVDIDRIGHGGHSYGAFATVNFMAHVPFFKAGIAGHGAYNRTLTPAGFQAERRTIWEAPSTYIEISPFFKAHQIQGALLMYHGTDDNNTGTFPIQSERLIQALTTLGKDAVLYSYPFESHTPRAIDNNLDMWARWIEWFDWYVKGDTERAVTAADADADTDAESDR
ncbi:MAG: prolyl oligopeptidase family serine peptidase, partial [Gemmatimonadota bacterium]